MVRLFGVMGLVFLFLGLTVCPLESFAATKSAREKAASARDTGSTASGKDGTGSVDPKALPVPQMIDAASFKATKLTAATPEETSKLRESAVAYEKRDYAGAIAILTQLAESGSARAAFSLGLMAMRGHGMPMSTETAERWWVRSAKGGFPDAQYHLGFMYHQSLRGGRNPELIAKLWTHAAAQGQGDAMYGLGYMYRAGDGVSRDLKKSLKMFTDAANLGHPGAAYEVGLIYKYGQDGTAKDASKARTFLTKAANAGVSPARQELATLK